MSSEGDCQAAQPIVGLEPRLLQPFPVQNGRHLLAGLDVGSTTVKAVVVEAQTGRITWKDYQRHDMHPAKKLLQLLHSMEQHAGVDAQNCRVFITGSGGGSLAELIGARFVQEVNAVAVAIEELHPEVGSVIELGGQDAKIIIFKDGGKTGRQKFLSMNDKCAAGTGVVIDKINAKLCIPADELCNLAYKGVKLYPIAGKCGVFAETDINDLQKQGIPGNELMASLFDALVLQTLTVLTRGHTLLPHVALLGGPNSFLRGMREAWQHNIAMQWQERGVELPTGAVAEDLIRTPQNALYFAAIGAVLSGIADDVHLGEYLGSAELASHLQAGGHEFGTSGSSGLVSSQQEADSFAEQYSPPPFVAASVHPGQLVRGFIGLDGGSTSTKAVLLSEQGEVLCKAYQLSKGNPIGDTIEVLGALRHQFQLQGTDVCVLGMGVTGYAKDILHRALHADVALVETVAHAQSALHFFADPHVIVDVGGQDIKLIMLANGAVKDFKLNTQCSAGNGYFLQSTCESLGIDVEQYAALAFKARSMPVFGYGCAVFLQSDIVNFQRKGWSAEEILAGLAAVLPKNVFLHVAKITDVAGLGSRFVLQGGTHKNLAVVKSTVDFLRAACRSSGKELEIHVHPHCAEAGAIGVGLEALRLLCDGRESRFIGLDAVSRLRYRSTRNEETRCSFCKNACLRTFLDLDSRDDSGTEETGASSGEFQGGERIILANCEKGAALEPSAVRQIQAALDQVRAASPNLVEWAAREVWRPRSPNLVAGPMPAPGWRASTRLQHSLRQRRAQLRIGIPRVLSMYAYAPLFSAYLQSLGIPAANIVYSAFTSAEMYRAGSSRGAIDPCFPSKIAIAHMHDLLFRSHALQPLDYIFFPMLDVLSTPLFETCASNACPTTSITPETVEAAYTKEVDLFAERGIGYIHPLLNLADRRYFARQMFAAWGGILGLSEAENELAVQAAFTELEAFDSEVGRRARQVLDQLEAEQRVGIVMLGRPYHHDPGVNHGILDELQLRGYPIFSQSTLPHDDDLLDRLFGDELRAGLIRHPLDISDVWKTTFSANSNLKLWAAKFTARHPNLVAVEISSFKCGHDAPIYEVIERIIECSGTPYFSFKDLDENRPTNTIKLRVETIDYFLRRYREEKLRRRSRAN